MQNFNILGSLKAEKLPLFYLQFKFCFRPKNLVSGPTAQGFASDQFFITHGHPMGPSFKPTHKPDFNILKTDTYT